MPRHATLPLALGMLALAAGLAWWLLRAPASTGPGAAPRRATSAIEQATRPEPVRSLGRESAGSLPLEASDPKPSPGAEQQASAPDAWVRVVDAATGEELRAVELFDCHADPRCRERRQVRDHPGVADPATTPATAPILASALADTGRFLVAAPGYAWGSFQVVRGVPAPETVALSKGCELSVRVLGGSVPDGAPLQLELREPWRSSPVPGYLLDVPAEGAGRFEHLLPGEYVARLQAPGAGRGEACAFGEPQELLLKPGSLASLVFDVSAPWRTAPTPVSGLVHVPPGAEILRVELVPLDVACLQPSPRKIQLVAGAGELEQDGEVLLRWEDLALAPGAWLVELAPLGYAAPVAIPAAPFHLLELAPPAPVEVTVRLVERASRETLRVEMLFAVTLAGSAPDAWRAWRWAGMGTGKSEELPDGSRRMHVSPGVVGFAAKAQQRPLRRHHVVEVQGPTEIVLEEDATADVRVAATSRGRPLALPHHRWTALDVRTAAGAEVLASFAPGPSDLAGAADHVALRLPAPGSYVVDLLGARATLDLAPGQERAEVVLDVGGR